MPSIHWSLCSVPDDSINGTPLLHPKPDRLKSCKNTARFLFWSFVWRPKCETLADGAECADVSHALRFVWVVQRCKKTRRARPKLGVAFHWPKLDGRRLHGWRPCSFFLFCPTRLRPSSATSVVTRRPFASAPPEVDSNNKMSSISQVKTNGDVSFAVSYWLR